MMPQTGATRLVWREMPALLPGNVTMKCSFCEQPLVCKGCNRPFRPRLGETHQGAYQPDTIVSCPECQKTLACKAYGFVYGEDEDKDESAK